MARLLRNVKARLGLTEGFHRDALRRGLRHQPVLRGAVVDPLARVDLVVVVLQHPHVPCRGGGGEGAEGTEIGGCERMLR